MEDKSPKSTKSMENNFWLIHYSCFCLHVICAPPPPHPQCYLSWPPSGSWHIRALKETFNCLCLLWSSSFPHTSFNLPSFRSFSVACSRVALSLPFLSFPVTPSVLWCYNNYCDLPLRCDQSFFMCTRYLNSSISGFMLALSRSSLVLKWSSHLINRIFFLGTSCGIHLLLCHLPCSFSSSHIRTTKPAPPVSYIYSLNFVFLAMHLELHMFFTLTNAPLALDSKTDCPKM